MNLGSNKTRVFVALLIHDGLAEYDETQHGCMDWAIWTQPKWSTGRGSLYRVQNLDPYNIHDDGLGHGYWRYRWDRGANYRRCPEMIGRIMVGKIPSWSSIVYLNRILRDILLPDITAWLSGIASPGFRLLYEIFDSMGL